VTQCWSVRALG